MKRPMKVTTRMKKVMEIEKILMEIEKILSVGQSIGEFATLLK